MDEDLDEARYDFNDIPPEPGEFKDLSEEVKDVIRRKLGQ